MGKDLEKRIRKLERGKSKAREAAVAAAWGAVGAWLWAKWGKPLVDRIPWHVKVVGGLLLAVLVAVFSPWKELAWPLLVAVAGVVAYRILEGRRDQVTKPERIVRDWSATTADIGALKGSTAKVLSHDKAGFTVQASLAGGKTVGDVQRATDALESVFKTKVGALRVVADPEHAHIALLRFTVRDPLEAPVNWPGPDAGGLADPVGLGVDESGQLVRVNLIGTHVLIGGQTGSGKSTVLGVLVRALVAMIDVEIWAVDAKPGAVEMGQYRDHLARIASEPVEVLQLLQDAKAEIAARGKKMAANRLTIYPISPQHPALVIVVDELAELSDAAKAELESLARLGRAMRVQLILATQRPSVEQLGGGSLRSSMSCTIGLKVRTSAESRLVFGDAAVAAGWDSSRLRVKGSFLLMDEQHQVPVPARCFWPGNRPVLSVLPEHEAETA